MINFLLRFSISVCCWLIAFASWQASLWFAAVGSAIVAIWFSNNAADHLKKL